MDRVRVLLLFGGESSEHDVSISSARNVYAAIDEEQYDTTLCYIDRNGKWWLIDSFDREIIIENAIQLLPMLGVGGFVTQPGGKTIHPDVLFAVLHGRNGEDGTVQGLAQLLHIPIVGCDITASVVAMNKLTTKEVLLANGISVSPYTVHRSYQDIPDFGSLTMNFGNPLFVKPARSGSSIGVSKVYTASEFHDALEQAHHEDDIVLIEKSVQGKELEVGVLGVLPKHRASGVGQVIPGDTFYSYDDKYSKDSSAVVTTQADITDAQMAEVQALALRVFEILDCRGLARIDFLLSQDGRLDVLEVNTLPGFTNISMYPKLWRQQGMSYTELISALLNDATIRSR